MTSCSRKQMSQHIKKIAMAINILVKDCDERVMKTVFKLPIKKIDGVEVFVSIQLNSFGHIYLKVESTNILFNTECSNECSNEFTYYCEALFEIPLGEFPIDNKLIKNIYSLKHIELAVEKASTIIPNLRFDKYNGDVTNRPIINIGDDLLNFCSSPQHTLSIEECCVCKEVTLTQTPCGHPLCFVCWENLPVLHKDCACGKYIKCPICRQNILCYEPEDEECDGNDSSDYDSDT